MRATWLIYVRDVTCSCVWRDSFIGVSLLVAYLAWQTRERHAIWYVCDVCDARYTYIYISGISGVTHNRESVTRFDMCVTWLIHRCVIARGRYGMANERASRDLICVWRDSLMCVTSRVSEPCRIRMSHGTYGCVIPYMITSCHMCMSHVTDEWVMPRVSESCHTWMSHATYERVVIYLNVSCHIRMSHILYEYVMPRRSDARHIRIKCFNSYVLLNVLIRMCYYYARHIRIKCFNSYVLLIKCFNSYV